MFIIALPPRVAENRRIGVLSLECTHSSVVRAAEQRRIRTVFHFGGTATGRSSSDADRLCRVADRSTTASAAACSTPLSGWRRTSSGRPSYQVGRASVRAGPPDFLVGPVVTLPTRL